LSSRGKTGLSLVLEAHLNHEGQFLSGKIIPMHMPANSLPRFDAGGQTIRLMQSLTQTDFPRSGPVINSDGSVRPR
jgi:hypothetical protein